MRGRGATLFRDISLEGGRCARKEALNLALLRVQREALSKSLSEVSERAREADREFSEDVAGRITSMLGLTEYGTVGPTGDGSALSNHARARIADMVQEAGRGERSRSQLLSN